LIPLFPIFFALSPFRAFVRKEAFVRQPQVSERRKERMQPQLAIVADDLTGGLDTGVAFAERGWRTVLRLAPHHASGITDQPCDAEVIVWVTEARNADEETACQAIRAVCAPPAAGAASQLFKKID